MLQKVYLAKLVHNVALYRSENNHILTTKFHKPLPNLCRDLNIFTKTSKLYAIVSNLTKPENCLFKFKLPISM